MLFCDVIFFTLNLSYLLLTLNLKQMVIGILKESGAERRVAMLPGEVAILVKLGVTVNVEK